MESAALTYQILGAAMEVHTRLGPGFVESIYKLALLHELQLRNLSAETEVVVRVAYKQRTVGKHRLDIVVHNAVILELKAVAAINDAHIAQVLSYLRATNLELALILNFGCQSLSWKRLIKSRR